MPGREEGPPTLDLHGETAAAARRLAASWLESRREESSRLVRVVTGRGLHSAGAPVLPGEIEDLLHSLLDRTVLRYWAEPGGGAFQVELLTLAAPRPRRPAPPRGDPRLRRRAEESLRELGIDPTPELVLAEMRRLRSG